MKEVKKTQKTQKTQKSQKPQKPHTDLDTFTLFIGMSAKTQ